MILKISKFLISAAIHAKGYFKDGQEYNFIYTLTQTSGTGDVATHISGNAYKAHTRIQRHGNDLNIEVSIIITILILLLLYYYNYYYDYKL